MKTPKSYKGKTIFFMIGFTTATSLFFLLGSFLLPNNLSDDSEKDFPQEYKIISPAIPDDLYFCDEKVPLDNFEVKERVDRELIVNTYWHSSTILAMKRANRWFPVIEPILKKNKIPDDFKYLAVIESNLDNVVSPAGATGFWQFMKEPAEKYGLEVNSEIDERYNVEKSTKAACLYLNDAYTQFKSWALAAAAFNMGFDGLQKQLDRQKTNNYYNLVLSNETSRYVARILALKEIFKYPKKYGFDLKPEDLYPQLSYYEVKVSSGVTDFADYAKDLGINYKILKYYNPWLRDNMLTNKKHITYFIKVPEQGSIKIIQDL